MNRYGAIGARVQMQSMCKYAIRNATAEYNRAAANEGWNKRKKKGGGGVLEGSDV